MLEGVLTSAWRDIFISTTTAISASHALLSLPAGSDVVAPTPARAPSSTTTTIGTPTSSARGATTAPLLLRSEGAPCRGLGLPPPPLQLPSEQLLARTSGP